MALQFFLGRSGSGKTYAMHQALAQAQRKGQKAVYLVPEQFSLQAEKELIAKTDGGGIFSVKVLTFDRLAHTVFSHVGAPKSRPLDEVSRAMALRKVVGELAPQLCYYQKAVGKQGFLEQLLDTVGEFFRYQLTPSQLLRTAEAAGEDLPLQEKLRDLAAIYEGYCRYLQEGYLSGEETLDLLYDLLEQAAFLTGSVFYVDGFYGFTPQEEQILQKLLALDFDVVVSLTMDPRAAGETVLPSDLFFEPKETHQTLCRLAKEVGAKIEKPRFFTQDYRHQTKALCHLEQSFGAYGVPPQEADGALRFWSGANGFEETERTALRILELVQEKGYRYRDVAVVAADLDRYALPLERVFTQCQIPYFLDRKKKITDTILAVAVLGIFRVVRFGFRFDDVFGLLKTGLTTFPREEVEQMENYCLRYGIKGWKWQKPWSLGLTEEGMEERYVALNRMRQQVVDFFAPLTERGKKKKAGVALWNEAFLDVLDRMGLSERLQAQETAFLEQKDQAAAYELRQSHQMVLTVLSALESVAGADEMTLEAYAALLESGLSVGKLAIIPPSVDCVTVGTVERSRLPHTKVLFVLGANDGLLPLAGAQGGIFTARERDLLEEKQLRLSHNGQRAAFEENYQIYQTLTKSEEQLVVSFSRSDLSGKALTPSVVVQQLRTLFPTVPLEEETLPDAYFYSPALTFGHLGQGLLEGDRVWQKAQEKLEAQAAFQSQMALFLAGEKAVETENRLEKETTQKAFGKTLFSSISRLERFISCPYRYFLTDTLGAKKRQEYGLANPDLGLLFHGVLEEFASTLKKEGKNWADLTEEEVKRRTEAAVERQAPLVGSEILLSTGSMQYLLKRLCRISCRAIWTLSRHLQAGQFRPYAFELTFGAQGVLPPIVVELGEGRRLVLNGQIDRVDLWEQQGTTYVKIVDYKTGKKEFRLQELYYGLQLQLLIYLDALLAVGKGTLGEKLLPGGVFYFRVQDPMVKATERLSVADVERMLEKEMTMSGLVLDDEAVIRAMDGTFEQESAILPVGYKKDGTPSAKASLASVETYGLLQQYAVTLAAQTAKRIQQGEIAVRPTQNGGQLPCDYCEFLSICGYEKGVTPKNILPALTKEEVIQKMAQAVEQKEE